MRRPCGGRALHDIECCKWARVVPLVVVVVIGFVAMSDGGSDYGNGRDYDNDNDYDNDLNSDGLVVALVVSQGRL